MRVREVSAGEFREFLIRNPSSFLVRGIENRERDKGCQGDKKGQRHQVITKCEEAARFASGRKDPAGQLNDRLGSRLHVPKQSEKTGSHCNRQPNPSQHEQSRTSNLSVLGAEQAVPECDCDRKERRSQRDYSFRHFVISGVSRLHRSFKWLFHTEVVWTREPISFPIS